MKTAIQRILQQTGSDGLIGIDVQGFWRTVRVLVACALSAAGGFDCLGARVSGAGVNASRKPGGIKSVGDGLPVTLLGALRAIFILRGTIK